MKTTNLLTIAAITGACFAIPTPQALAQNATEADRIEKLERAVENLLEQNKTLQSQIDVLTGGAKSEAATSASASDPGTSLYDDKDVRVFWKNGLKFESGDKKSFKGGLGGRIQLDTSGYSESGDIADIDPGVEFRRARIYLNGEFQSSLKTFYKFETDFAGEDVNLTDVYLGVSGLPAVNKLKVGHFKRPLGLEELTSSRFITFMERSTATEAFNKSRDVGLEFSNANEDQTFTWAAGAFHTVDSLTAAGSFEDTSNSLVARVTGLPVYEDDGRTLVHLGLGGEWEHSTDAGFRYRARPESHRAPRLIDTGTIAGDDRYLVNGEAAAVFGPLSFQGELYYNHVEANAMPNADFFGGYAQCSYFLTGEHRPYKKSSGAFDRVKPNRNFSLGEGPGAWETAVRYSYTDLSDGPYMGGELGVISAGISWYLNPNTRAILNYGFADVDESAADGNLHTVQLRLQVDY